MNKKRSRVARTRQQPDQVADLLRTLIVVQLGLAGLTNAEILAVVGGDVNRVSKIVKPIRAARRREKE